MLQGYKQKLLTACYISLVPCVAWVAYVSSSERVTEGGTTEREGHKQTTATTASVRACLDVIDRSGGVGRGYCWRDSSFGKCHQHEPGLGRHPPTRTLKALQSLHQQLPRRRPLPLPTPHLQLRQTQFGVVSATTYFTRTAGPFVVPLVLYIASYVLLQIFLLVDKHEASQNKKLADSKKKLIKELKVGGGCLHCWYVRQGR